MEKNRSSEYMPSNKADNCYSKVTSNKLNNRTSKVTDMKQNSEHNIKKQALGPNTER